jgi:predicted RNA-binding protein YlxR (DUF448 family)
MSPRHEPERTCVVCRSRAPKRALLRAVRRPDGQVVVDTTGRVAGRGAYIHRVESCLRPVAATALGRALGAPLPSAEAARLTIELQGIQEERT